MAWCRFEAFSSRSGKLYKLNHNAWNAWNVRRISTRPLNTLGWSDCILDHALDVMYEITFSKKTSTEKSTHSIEAVLDWVEYKKKNPLENGQSSCSWECQVISSEASWLFGLLYILVKQYNVSSGVSWRWNQFHILCITGEAPRAIPLKLDLCFAAKCECLQISTLNSIFKICQSDCMHSKQASEAGSSLRK